MIAQQLLNALVVGSVYALFALGFTLIFGVHHILNLAHGAVFMWGAFVGLYAVTLLHAPFPVALLCASVVGRPAQRGARLDRVPAAAPARRAGVLRDHLQHRRRPDPDEHRAARVADAGDALSVRHVSDRGVLGVRAARDAAAAADRRQRRASSWRRLFAYIFYTGFGRQIRAVAVNERTAVAARRESDRASTSRPSSSPARWPVRRAC